MKLVAAGALDRHPGPEGAGLRGRRDLGAVPRRPHGRGYRQHGIAVRPKLRQLPKEYLYEQVYA